MGPLVRGFRHLREERTETRGQKIACVGFCMGGGLSALLACEEPELSGAAVFYGMAPPAEKIAAIACPVIAFYGAMDQRVNAGIPGFQEAMRAAGKSFEHHIYEGAGHAFFNDDGPSYDVNAARDSYARLLAFFAKDTLRIGGDAWIRRSQAAAPARTAPRMPCHGQARGTALQHALRVLLLHREGGGIAGKARAACPPTCWNASSSRGSSPPASPSCTLNGTGESRRSWAWTISVR